MSHLDQPDSPCTKEAEGCATVLFPNRSCWSPAALGDAAGSRFCARPAAQRSQCCFCTRSMDAFKVKEFGCTGLPLELSCSQLSEEDRWRPAVRTDCFRDFTFSMSERVPPVIKPHCTPPTPPNPAITKAMDSSSLVKLHNEMFQRKGEFLHVVHGRRNIYPTALKEVAKKERFGQERSVPKQEAPLAGQGSEHVCPLQLTSAFPLLRFCGSKEVNPAGMWVCSVILATFPFGMCSLGWSCLTCVSIGSLVSSAARREELKLESPSSTWQPPGTGMALN